MRAFIVTIILIGLIGGMLYVIFLNKSGKNILITSMTNFITMIKDIKINFLATHLLIIPLLIVSSFLLVGIPIGIFYLFYNGFLMGFLISNFFLVKHLKGLIFGIIYLIITRLVFCFFYFILLINLLKIGYQMINLVFKKRQYHKDYVLMYLKKCLICLIFILINDLILYFLGDNLVNIFKFLVI